MRKSIAILAFIVIIAFMVLGALRIQDFGEPVNEDMDNYFLANSQDDDETNNVVAAILFDYRGIDTLGEATILFSAVSGVLTVLRTMKRVNKGIEKEGDLE